MVQIGSVEFVALGLQQVLDIGLIDQAIGVEFVQEALGGIRFLARL